jgi:hypothetical protein
MFSVKEKNQQLLQKRCEIFRKLSVPQGVSHWSCTVARFLDTGPFKDRTKKIVKTVDTNTTVGKNCWQFVTYCVHFRMCTQTAWFVSIRNHQQFMIINTIESIDFFYQYFNLAISSNWSSFQQSKNMVTKKFVDTQHNLFGWWILQVSKRRVISSNILWYKIL